MLCAGGLRGCVVNEAPRSPQCDGGAETSPSITKPQAETRPAPRQEVLGKENTFEAGRDGEEGFVEEAAPLSTSGREDFWAEDTEERRGQRWQTLAAGVPTSPTFRDNGR